MKVWEFRQVPKGFWENIENRRNFVIWVAEKEGLDINTKDGLRKITANVLYKYGGGKPMRYAGGLYELLDTVACGKYKKWEIIKMVSWNQEEIIEATKWLIEEKLRYSPKQVCGIKVSDFAKNNLEGMLRRGCNHNIFTALEVAYPGRYYCDGKKGICLK